MNKIFLFISIVALYSCQHSGREHAEHSTGDHGFTPVELNAGARWAANPETTEGMRSMAKTLASFQPSDELDDYRALHSQLAEDLQFIVKNCDMTGESHEQLHHYLEPVQHHLSVLRAGEIDAAAASYRELKGHLITYGDFFE